MESGMLRLAQCFVGLLIVFALVGCSSNTPATTTAAPLRQVTVQLDWIPTVEYAGFYLAQANGYFAEENLEVEFIPNDGSILSMDVLANGDLDFAVAGADVLLRTREAGKDVVGIATIYQRLPLAFMSLAESNITTPQDMVGKTVMISMDRTSEFAFTAMTQITGVDMASMTIVPREVYDESPLLNGEVDVIDVFVTNQVVQMERAGVDVNLILPLDYGVEMYVNVIATRQATIDADPELVEAFVRAATRGYEAAIADPQAATDATLAVNPDLNAESELQSMQASLPFIHPRRSQSGQMSVETWQFIYDMLTDQQILTQEQDITSAYNLQFLNAIYNGQ
jgi:NitT/TauT family transport system substrate-binding protein